MSLPFPAVWLCWSFQAWSSKQISTASCSQSVALKSWLTASPRCLHLEAAGLLPVTSCGFHVCENVNGYEGARVVQPPGCNTRCLARKLGRVGDAPAVSSESRFVAPGGRRTAQTQRRESVGSTRNPRYSTTIFSALVVVFRYSHGRDSPPYQKNASQWDACWLPRLLDWQHRISLLWQEIGHLQCRRPRDSVWRRPRGSLGSTTLQVTLARHPPWSVLGGVA